MNQSTSAQPAKVSGGSTATSSTRALLCVLCLSILVACGNGGGRATAEEGGGVVHRLLEGSSLLTFSPDPPSPSSVVTARLTGTFRLEVSRIKDGVDVTELRLRAGERFVVEGAQRVAGTLWGRETVPFQQTVGGELVVTINGRPVELRGGGPILHLGEALANAAYWNFCDPPERCDEIRAGRTAGYALEMFALPEWCAPKQ
jgi:hypothetical protein